MGPGERQLGLGWFSGLAKAIRLHLEPSWLLGKWQQFERLLRKCGELRRNTGRVNLEVKVRFKVGKKRYRVALISLPFPTKGLENKIIYLPECLSIYSEKIVILIPDDVIFQGGKIRIMCFWYLFWDFIKNFLSQTPPLQLIIYIMHLIIKFFPFPKDMQAEINEMLL